MKIRLLTEEDVRKYRKDLLKCYNDNRLVFDNQCPIYVETEGQAEYFVSGYVVGADSFVFGIFDDNEKYLYGIVMFDKIRRLDISCAEVHIVIDRAIWGKVSRDIFSEIIDMCMIDNLYCTIPAIAVNAIAVAKRLGFKKTGYIPKVAPYTNCRGEEKLYDIIILTREVK